jgi:hypothetical protein
MRFHYQSSEFKKLEVRQIEITKTNIVVIYALMNIIRDHFDMSTLFLLLDELFVMRSTRRERFLSSSSRNDDERNDDDDDDDDDESDKNDEKNDDDEDDENDENDDVENDET